MHVEKSMDFADDTLNSLLLDCQKNDPKAFQELYQLTSKRLVGIAFRITNNTETANEVLQEAFIQIWQKSELFDEQKSRAFTWLASIIRYRAYDRVRHEKARKHDMHIEFEDDDFFLGDKLHDLADKLNTEHNGMLDYCLKQLELEHKQSVLMAYLYGYSREDISEYFKTPVNTVKSWIRRGLGRLQTCLIN
jgi:RNA polymerase sigma-70 factor (ECF subfamily)